MSKDYPLPLEELEKKIKYIFNNKNYAELALTHSSFSNEMRSRDIKSECNERLEFLGDSVLSFITSEYIYEKFSEYPEGELSKIRSNAVCEKALYILACDIELGKYLRLGHGEENTNGRNRPSILADAFEAMLAAIFIDGGIDAAKNFLLPRISVSVEKITKQGNDLDYKTALQQMIQREKGDILEYFIVNETGPAHKRVFSVEAKLNGNIIGRGNGTSKRAAEQNAAKEALELFGI